MAGEAFSSFDSSYENTYGAILYNRKTQLIAKIKLTFIKSVRIIIFVGRCDSACIIKETQQIKLRIGATLR